MLLVVISLLCQRLGASIAGLMFGRVDSSGMVALRLVFSACLLLALGRPSRAALRRLGTRGWVAVVGLGLTMAGMNLLIRQAFDPIPQGVAVTFEVLGPLALSVLARRRWDTVACALLALVGIGVLGREGFSADAGLDSVLALSRDRDAGAAAHVHLAVLPHHVPLPRRRLPHRVGRARPGAGLR